MSLTEKRALRIAFGDRPIVHVGGPIWEVPSESQAGVYYAVNLARGTCEHPGWRRGRPDKHIRAAQLELAKRKPGGGEIPPVPNPYKQPPWYAEIKQREEVSVMEMVRCFGRLETYVAPAGRGRPPVSYGDLIVCGLRAAYLNRPTLKAIPDPEWLVHRGYVQRRPPKPSTYKSHMRSERLRRALRNVLRIIVDCVRGLESEFVLDSTYFRTPNSEVVVQVNGARYRMRNGKCHFASGQKTLIVLGTHLVEESESDQLGFIPVLEQFWNRFRVDAVYADAGYCSADHYEDVAAHGGVAYIDFVEDRRAQPGKHHYNAMLEMHDTRLDEWAS